jgi:RND family efflux transporter MFP subunit
MSGPDDPKPRRMRWVAIVLVLVAAGGAAGLVYRDRVSLPAPEQDAGAEALAGTALTVTAVQPVQVLWPEKLAVNGAITPWQEAVVSAEVSGVSLLAVLVDVGDQVEKGQVLARFDAAPLEAAYAEQKAALDDAQARVMEAEANVVRARQLRETQAISEFDLIKATAAAQAAQAQAELARARLRSQQLALGHAEVTAPDDGVISERSAMLGAVAAPGVEMFRLVRQNRLEWQAQIMAGNLAVLSPGQSAELRLPGGEVVSGTIRQVAPVVDAGTRTGIAYVSLDPAAANVRAGMYASGSLLLGERVGMALPASAIIQRDGFEYVFRLDGGEDPRVLQTKVRSGRRLEGDVEILEGISRNDQVVKSGGEFLSDGDRVRVLPAPPPVRELGSAS